MGKQKRERSKPHKKNPTGLVSVKQFEEEAEDFVGEDHDEILQRIFDQLQSPYTEERLLGLQTLETTCSDSSIAIRIAKEGVAKIVGSLLVDPDKVVQASSARALRRIAENGGEEVYSNFLKNDIMTPLTALLEKYHSVWQPMSDDKEIKIANDTKETFVQAVTLLWTLCENDESAVKYSNERSLVLILAKYFDPSTCCLDMSIAAAQCALTLSEDNPTAIAELKRHEASLLDIMTSKCEKDAEFSRMMLLKTLMAGILTNGNGSFFTESKDVCVIRKVILTISETLTKDHRNLLNSLTSMLPIESISPSSKSDAKLQEAKTILDAQQQALEILTNLCSDEHGSDVSSDLEDSDSAEFDVEYMDEESPNFKAYSSVPVELIEVMNSCNVIKMVWDKTIPLAENVRQILTESSEGETILGQVRTLRCRAFLCLNNLLSSLDIGALGGIDNLYRLWNDIGGVVFKHADPNDIELLESGTAAMRAALQKLAEVRANTFDQLTIADIQPMLNAEMQCPNANVRANVIRMVGNVALILNGTSTMESYELVKHVSIFLLDICTKENEAWVIAESLDTIMDIYSEDETNRLAADISLVQKLQYLVPVLNDKVRQQKKRLGSNALVVSTVKTNLMPFIRYKGRQTAKLK